MNRKFIKFSEGYSKSDLLKFKKSNIRYIPIVSKKNEIIDLIDLSKLKTKFISNDVFI